MNCVAGRSGNIQRMGCIGRIVDKGMNESRGQDGHRAAEEADKWRYESGGLIIWG